MFEARRIRWEVYEGTSDWMWFGFDPLGRCVKRWKASPSDPNPVVTYFYYDGSNLIEEVNAATGNRLYVHGGRVDEIVASQVGGIWYHHHYDAQGNCILQSKADGTVEAQYEYDAFGFPYVYDAAGHNGIAQTRFLFTGREWLSDLRLYDYRARLYQPELGRFLQPDPTGFAAGDYNLYRYCHNDPVNHSDPTGLLTDRTFDRQLYLQGGAKESFQVVEWIKDMRSNGWVRVGDMVVKEGNPDNSTAPGKAVRNLGISWLFEKDGKPGVYAASMPIPGSTTPRRVKSEGNQPRLGAQSIPTFIPKGYHYVGFAYAHLLADKDIPLRDRVRAWYNRADAYLAVPQPGNGFSRLPKVLAPYRYDPNVFPSD